eukprot:jgi/Phyca11/128394/e_gw1.75.86.1
MNDNVNDPENLDEAMKSPQRKHWEEAIRKEFASLKENMTWKLVKRPRDTRVLTTKWVLRVKRDEHGNVQRYKARLVVHGFKQRFGKEFWKTYSPVVRWVTMLIVLVVALLLSM